MPEITFDRNSAQQIKTPFPCFHDVWRDVHGNYVMMCVSTQLAGGVSVSEQARNWLLQVAKNPQVILTSRSENPWEWRGAISDLPHKEPQNAKFGVIRIYDRVDLFPMVQENLPGQLQDVVAPATALAVLAPNGNGSTPPIAGAGYEELTVPEWCRRIAGGRRDMTNPTLETLRLYSSEYPFSVHIEEGKSVIRWRS